MSNLENASRRSVTGLATGTWRLDPDTSVVEFRVPHIYGLATVVGRFTNYHGSLDLNASPAVQLWIDATSVDTGNTLRDRHLRSAHYFDTGAHPTIRFEAQETTITDDRLIASGHLTAAGRTVPLSVNAAYTRIDHGFVIAAEAFVDQRDLGMTHNPLGLARTPTTLTVSGQLFRAS